MFGRITRSRIGAVALSIAVAAGIFGGVALAPAEPVSAQQCYERYVGSPVNENGIQCPGDPAIWKSFTFASHGFGYYTETYDLGMGNQEVRIGYRHRDGRIAVAIFHCTPGGCVLQARNNVPFPFEG